MVKKIYHGAEYDEDYMLECIKNFPKIIARLNEAKQSVDLARNELEDAEEELDLAEIEFNNHQHEWKGFKPYEDKLAIRSKR